jgi:hypothetical protein
MRYIPMELQGLTLQEVQEFSPALEKDESYSHHADGFFSFV